MTPARQDPLHTPQAHPRSTVTDQTTATEATELDTCKPVDVDGETVRVRGSGDLTEEGQEAMAALVRAARAKFVAEAPEQVGVLQNRLRLAHKARRAKEHQLDGIRRALCDAGFMEEDDPYSHADLEEVVRQAGKLLDPLLAEVAAARKFAGEMRDFCSPHGVAADYADRLVEAMDRAKSGGNQLEASRGPVPVEYVRLKDQLEADLHKMTACAAQEPKEGAEGGRIAQGGIAAGIRSSLAWAIQCFEGSGAREAFLKRLEGGQ